MSDIDIQRLIEIAEEKLREPLTTVEALQSLVDAGILDRDGNPTQPYAALAGAEQE